MAQADPKTATGKSKGSTKVAAKVDGAIEPAAPVDHGRPKGPLTGVTVVDLTRVLAGPYCTMVLADLGARVIKVEQPGTGDDSRAFGPFVKGKSAYFSSLNRGKESIALDLKKAGDKLVFEKLLERADVLVENFRPGTMEKLGFGYEALHEKYPRLIYAAASGFGHTGPYSKRAAYDMVVQAMGGLMSVTGTADGPPVRVGTSIGDITAGLFTAIGVNAALLHRSLTGEAIKVDVAMLDCQVAILENAIARYAATGEVAGPLGARHPSITPFSAFEASDGHLVIAAGNDALFAKLCDTLGLPKLAQDKRYKTNALRTDNWQPLFAEINAALAAKPIAEWLTALDLAGVPCGPINTVDKVLADPHVRSRNMVVTANDPDNGPLVMAGNPIKLSSFDDPDTRRAAPGLDADRDAILDEVKARPAGGALVPVTTLDTSLMSALALTRQSPQRVFDYLRSVVVGTTNPAVAVMKDGSFIERVESLADALMSERGEVLGTVIANDLVRLVRSAGGAERFELLSLLSRKYNPDPAKVRAATDVWRAKPTPENMSLLAAAVESPRQELFRRMNMAPDGTATLVKLREHLGQQIKDHPEFSPLDTDLRHLLASWFNRGFLELQRISWHTPAAILEKLIAYEAVHAIDGWDDLRRRLASDRRCFGFFHPGLPDEPLIFVEVALTNEISGKITPIIRAPMPGEDRAEPDTAIFYSISNCQPGLRGISFGNFLIKQVAADLAKELPGLKTFSTLSPMPGFRRWMDAAETDLAALIPKPLAERVLKEGEAGTLRESLRNLTVRGEQEGYVRSTLLRDVLLRLGVRYLTGANQKRGISDPVARFHLGNGARIERVNWMADVSEKGIRESHGLMVNYLYDLGAVEKNHEAFANGRAASMSDEVAALIAKSDGDLSSGVLKKSAAAALDMFGGRKG
jgi:CoA:oxalate CoA-transferase